jgi:hypothetical protein
MVSARVGHRYQNRLRLTVKGAQLLMLQQLRRLRYSKAHWVLRIMTMENQDDVCLHFKQQDLPLLRKCTNPAVMQV